MEVVRFGDEGSPVHARPAVGAAADGLPLVVVTWRDAWFDFEHDDEVGVRADYLVTTVGFVVREGPRFVSVAQEVLPDGDGFRAVTHIPLSVIESVTPLRVHDAPAGAAADGLYSPDPDATSAPDRGRRDA